MRGVMIVAIALGLATAAQAEPQRNTEARVNAAEARLRISDNTARAHQARERAADAAKTCEMRGGTQDAKGVCSAPEEQKKPAPR